MQLQLIFVLLKQNIFKVPNFNFGNSAVGFKESFVELSLYNFIFRSVYLTMNLQYSSVF